MDENSTHPLEAAAKVFGSEAALARALQVSRAALNQWKKPGRQVPAQYCPRIEALTGVKCELLCPSVDWAYLRRAARERRSSRALKSDAAQAEA